MVFYDIMGRVCYKNRTVCVSVDTLLFHYKIPRDIIYNDQAQASDQFLATTKLAINKAICLKTKTKW